MSRAARQMLAPPPPKAGFSLSAANTVPHAVAARQAAPLEFGERSVIGARREAAHRVGERRLGASVARISVAYSSQSVAT
jgi:hypothetical protein